MTTISRSSAATISEGNSLENEGGDGGNGGDEENLPANKEESKMGSNEWGFTVIDDIPDGMTKDEFENAIEDKIDKAMKGKIGSDDLNNIFCSVKNSRILPLVCVLAMIADEPCEDLTKHKSVDLLYGHYMAHAEENIAEMDKNIGYVHTQMPTLYAKNITAEVTLRKAIRDEKEQKGAALSNVTDELMRMQGGAEGEDAEMVTKEMLRTARAKRDANNAATANAFAQMYAAQSPMMMPPYPAMDNPLANPIAQAMMNNQLAFTMNPYMARQMEAFNAETEAKRKAEESDEGADEDSDEDTDDPAIAKAKLLAGNVATLADMAKVMQQQLNSFISESSAKPTKATKVGGARKKGSKKAPKNSAKKRKRKKAKETDAPAALDADTKDDGVPDDDSKKKRRRKKRHTVASRRDPRASDNEEDRVGNGADDGDKDSDDEESPIKQVYDAIGIGTNKDGTFKFEHRTSRIIRKDPTSADISSGNPIASIRGKSTEEFWRLRGKWPTRYGRSALPIDATNILDRTGFHWGNVRNFGYRFRSTEAFVRYALYMSATVQAAGLDMAKGHYSREHGLAVLHCNQLVQHCLTSIMLAWTSNTGEAAKGSFCSLFRNGRDIPRFMPGVADGFLFDEGKPMSAAPATLLPSIQRGPPRRQQGLYSGPPPFRRAPPVGNGQQGPRQVGR